MGRVKDHWNINGQGILPFPSAATVSAGDATVDQLLYSISREKHLISPLR